MRACRAVMLAAALLGVACSGARSPNIAPEPAPTTPPPEAKSAVDAAQEPRVLLLTATPLELAPLLDRADVADMLETARAVPMWPLQLERCNAAGRCADGDPRVVVGGNGLGQEAAAVGHVAWVNALPYIGIRAIASLTGAETAASRGAFTAMAARNAAAVTEAWLQAWAERGGPGSPR